MVVSISFSWLRHCFIIALSLIVRVPDGPSFLLVMLSLKRLHFLIYHNDVPAHRRPIATEQAKWFFAYFHQNINIDLKQWNEERKGVGEEGSTFEVMTRARREDIVTY